MGTNEFSQPASKSSWDSQDFGDVNMALRMAHFHKSSRPQWVKEPSIWYCNLKRLPKKWKLYVWTHLNFAPRRLYVLEND